jgi:hypothetical protein
VTQDINATEALPCSVVGDFIATYIEEKGDLKIQRDKIGPAHTVI